MTLVPDIPGSAAEAADGQALALSGRARALFTGRAEGNMSSAGGEEAELGASARERLRVRTGALAIARGYQVHGIHVSIVCEMPAPERASAPPAQADGQATAVEGLAVMVLSADCLPVALGCESAVAIVHAGWRGLAGGVLEQGVRALEGLAAGERITAIVGPGAGVCCYEVGPEVHEALGGVARRRGPVDLRAIAEQRLLAAGVAEVGHVRGVHRVRRALLLPPPRRGAGGAPGGGGMAELISGVRADTVAENLRRIREQVADAAERGARARRERHRGVEVLAASKYLAEEDLPLLARAGVTLLGENRAQDLERKVAAHGDLFEWDFIGQLQSRRVRLIVPHVRLIHSVASVSALAELERRLELARPGLAVLIEVNLAGEHGKAGIAPAELDEMIARAPVPVVGLMTMPPLSSDPEEGRRWFAALRELARERDLPTLSMGTSQDYVVAAEEGATIVRIGTNLYT